MTFKRKITSVAGDSQVQASNGFVLDNTPALFAEGVNEYNGSYSHVPANNLGAAIPQPGVERIDDSPSLALNILAYEQDRPEADKLKSIYDSFQTYLIFKADGLGKWVVLSKITWSLDGEATLNAGADGSNPANWQVAANQPPPIGPPAPPRPAAAGTILGDKANSFMRWRGKKSIDITFKPA